MHRYVYLLTRIIVIIDSHILTDRAIDKRVQTLICQNPPPISPGAQAYPQNDDVNIFMIYYVQFFKGINHVNLYD